MSEENVNLHTLHRDIGLLTGMVKNLDRRSEIAEEKRSKIYESLEQFRMSVHDLDGRVANMERQVKEMEPYIRKLQRAEERGRGALMMAGLIGGTGAGALSFILAKWPSIASIIQFWRS